MQTTDKPSTSNEKNNDTSKQSTVKLMDLMKQKDPKSILKRKNSNDDPSISDLKREKLGLFSNVVMFIPEILSDNTLKSEINNFKREGGRIAKSSIEATHVLHDSSLIESDLNQLRLITFF